MRKIMIAAALATAATPALAQVDVSQGLVDVTIQNVSILNNFLNDAQIAALNGVSVPVNVQVPVADDQYPGGWAPHGVPQRWQGDPAREVLRGEVRSLVSTAMDALPERQRAVLLLRDVQGCDSDEVCQILELTPENQRVLLHRGRARMRASLEDYYRRGDE